MTQILSFIILINIIFNKYTYGFKTTINLTRNHAFDLQLYEDVLDPVLCQKQLNYLRENNTLLLATFMDAGIRTPKGILTGNLRDMGNYYQCIRIKEALPDYVIEGKYCSIYVPMDFWYSLPSSVISTDYTWRDGDPNKFPLDKDILYRLKKFQGLKQSIDAKLKVVSRYASKSKFQGLSFNLAICLPKVCTTSEAINGLLLNTTPTDFVFQDNFCRLPDDKHWVPADYVAIVIFSLIGLLTILSTSYDVYYNVLTKTDIQQNNQIWVAFSVYTNTRRLVTYRPVTGTLECLDGIRVMAMMWVVIGHTFMLHLTDFMANPVHTFEWMVSWKSLWVTSAPITVDTFFTLTGLLLVYTTAGKLTGVKLLKNLHWFYMNRLLRMFPILATFVLLQASFLNRVTDGPDWNLVVAHTHRCRLNWWATLLYIQNFAKFDNTCLYHTWYLAIDMQLYLISPIILYWVLSDRKRYALSALVVALSCVMISTSIYNIKMRFPSGPVVPSRYQENGYYMVGYYINPLTRSPPFFIGMVYGYLLHLNRNKNVMLSKPLVVILWIYALVIMGTVIYSTYPILQLDWNNQLVDTLINCLMKPAWAFAIGWIVFACTHGYSGPINWFLSLRLWKIPSRLSYAVYISHYPLLIVVNSTTLAPVYFTMSFAIMHFINILVLTTTVSFFAVVLIDAPCSVLIKQLIGAGYKQPQNRSIQNDLSGRTRPTNGYVNNVFIPNSLKCESK